MGFVNILYHLLVGSTNTIDDVPESNMLRNLGFLVFG